MTLQQPTTHHAYETPSTPDTTSADTNIDLRGYTAEGVPKKGWRGRNDGRNCAFADLLFESGLRLREDAAGNAALRRELHKRHSSRATAPLAIQEGTLRA